MKIILEKIWIGCVLVQCILCVILKNEFYGVKMIRFDNKDFDIQFPKLSSMIFCKL